MSKIHDLWQWLVSTVTSSSLSKPSLQPLSAWETLYDSALIPEENNQWGVFWHEWWGANSPGKARLELAARQDPQTPSSHRILQVAQDAIWRKLNTLGDSHGSILLREEYISLYSTLSASLEGMCSGVKVSGHPGLGKSYSLVYALLRRMSEGRPVLFSTSANSTLLIDRHGVRSMATDQVEVEHLIRVSDPYVPTSPIWSLIDASMSSQAAMSTLVHPNLFVVFASYPRAQGYMGWTEQSMAQQFIMEPWFVWELEWLLSVDGLTPLSQDQRAPYNQQRRNLEHLVHEVGPGPRDIFSYVSSPNEYKKRIRSVLKEIQGWRDVHNLFATADRTMSWEAQHLVVLRKAHVPGATDMASDLPIVCFKSRDIGLDVMRQVGYLGVEDAMEIFMKNRRWPGSRVLARWVFESLVVGIISGGGTSLNSLSDVLFQPQPSDRGPLLPRSIKSRRVAPGPGCEGVSALTLDDDLCYFPLRRDNPVFDAFYLDVTPNTVIIWLFKIQIPRKCVDGYSDAFSMVDVLLEKAKIQFGKPKVQLKYVVIAPQHGHNQPAVTLGVPERWSEFKGDVHVCYLDVAHLGCDIDDLLADLSESD